MGVCLDRKYILMKSNGTVNEPAGATLAKMSLGHALALKAIMESKRELLDHIQPSAPYHFCMQPAKGLIF